MTIMTSNETSLRLDLTALNNKVLPFESNETKTSTSTDQLPQLLLEISESEKCSFNAIIHELLESTSTSPVGRIVDDIKLLSDTTQLLSITLPPNIKSLRLGRTNNNNL